MHVLYFHNVNNTLNEIAHLEIMAKLHIGFAPVTIFYLHHSNFAQEQQIFHHFMTGVPLAVILDGKLALLSKQANTIKSKSTVAVWSLFETSARCHMSTVLASKTQRGEVYRPISRHQTLGWTLLTMSTLTTIKKPAHGCQWQGPSSPLCKRKKPSAKQSCSATEALQSDVELEDGISHL